MTANESYPEFCSERVASCRCIYRGFHEIHQCNCGGEWRCLADGTVEIMKYPYRSADYVMDTWIEETP